MNYDLQSHLLHALCTDGAEHYKDEIVKLGEKIMAYCTDQTVTLWTKYQLIRQYVKWDMKEQAKKIVYSLPSETYYTQELTLKYVLEGEEWLEDQVMRIERFSIMFCDFVEEYIQKAELDIAQKIEWSKAIMQIEDVTRQISGEQVNHIVNDFHHVYLAQLHCEVGDAENAVKYVELATQDSMHHIHQMDQTTETGNNYYPWTAQFALDFVGRPPSKLGV